MTAVVLDLAACRERRDAQVRILSDLIRFRLAGVDTAPFFEMLASTELFAEFRQEVA
jgi:hypothetical protein